MNKFLEYMNTEQVHKRKVFEFFPALMLIQTAPKDLKRLREFIVEIKGNFFLMDESYELYDNGKIEFWQIISQKGYNDLDLLCRDIFMKKQLLIGLN